MGTIGGGGGVEGKVGLSDKFSLGSPDPVFAPLTQALLIHSKAELIGVALNNRTKRRKAELLSFLMSPKCSQIGLEMPLDGIKHFINEIWLID